MTTNCTGCAPQPPAWGHLFPRLLGQSEYNDRVKALAPLMDATPIPCGHSVITAKRSDLFGWAGYGYCPSHSRWYWGSKLLLICTCDGTVTGFCLANPKLFGTPVKRSLIAYDH